MRTRRVMSAGFTLFRPKNILFYVNVRARKIPHKNKAGRRYLRLRTLNFVPLHRKINMAELILSPLSNKCIHSHLFLRTTINYQSYSLHFLL